MPAPVLVATAAPTAIVVLTPPRKLILVVATVAVASIRPVRAVVAPVAIVVVTPTTVVVIVVLPVVPASPVVTVVSVVPPPRPAPLLTHSVQPREAALAVAVRAWRVAACVVPRLHVAAGMSVHTVMVCAGREATVVSRQHRHVPRCGVTGAAVERTAWGTHAAQRRRYARQACRVAGTSPTAGCARAVLPLLRQFAQLLLQLGLEHGRHITPVDGCGEWARTWSGQGHR